MTARLTLVVGARIDARETAIADRLRTGMPTAVILEGLPDGSDVLSFEPPLDAVWIARIAPGCLCCIGNLTLRVTLNRMLRKRPHHIYISVADRAHLAALQACLSAAPYDDLLQLTTIIDCDAPAHRQMRHASRHVQPDHD